MRLGPTVREQSAFCFFESSFPGGVTCNLEVGRPSVGARHQAYVIHSLRRVVWCDVELAARHFLRTQIHTNKHTHTAHIILLAQLESHSFTVLGDVRAMRLPPINAGK